MWNFIVQAGLLAAAYGYHRYIQEHAKPKPALGLGVPAVANGSPIPLIYGTCRVRAPVLAWAGNFDPTPLSDIGHAGVDEAEGFQYRTDLLFVIGIPFYDGLVSNDFVLYCDDTVLLMRPWLPPEEGPPGDPTEAAHVWDHPTAIRRKLLGFPEGQILANIYGGYGLGGGVGHRIEFWQGHADQVISDGNDFSFTELALVADGTSATLIPGYRRQAAILLYRWSVGESPAFQRYSFGVCSVPSAGMPSYLGNWPPEAEDADPAAVLHDLITSPWGKLGLSADSVDRPSFEAASLTLFNEEHGYSRAIEQSEDAATVIGDILEQIDGMIYQEPTTGKLVLKLVRNDFDFLTLDDINPSNMATPEGGWYKVQGWSESYNQVRVLFIDRSVNFASGMAIGQNQANVISQGGRLRSIDIDYPGCSNGNLAQKLASRELAVLSRPQVQATVVVDRTFYGKRPGDVVTLTWPELGIDRMIMRIVKIDLGQLHAGQIRLDLIRDIFDVSIGAYPVPAKV